MGTEGATVLYKYINYCRRVPVVVGLFITRSAFHHSLYIIIITEWALLQAQADVFHRLLMRPRVLYVAVDSFPF